MSGQLLDVLKITIVGMGLVFGAIFLLWGIMAVLVSLTSTGIRTGTEQANDELELKKRAAAAAVGAALTNQSENRLHEFPLPPTALVSAWQAVMRTRILNKRGRVR